MTALQKILVAVTLLVFTALFGALAWFVFAQDKKSEDATFGVPWAPYTPKVGGFSMTFPRRPNETQTPAQIPPVTHIASYSLVHDPGVDEEYQVEVTELPPVGNVEKALDAAVDEFADREHATVVSRSKIVLDGTYAGRAVVLQERDSKPAVAIKMRQYFVGSRHYVMFCKAVKDDAAIERFLSSFKLSQ